MAEEKITQKMQQTCNCNMVVSNHVNSDHVPSFHVLTSEMLGRRLPVYTLLLLQRQHIIVVDAIDYT
jgi:hypothetical protein